MSPIRALVVPALALSIVLAPIPVHAQDRWATRLSGYASPIDGVRAYVTKDARLYSVRLVSGTWIWSDLGRPSAGVRGVPAATAGSPATWITYVFVAGNDGHLYVNQGDDTKRIWEDLGKPSGTQMAGDPASNDPTGNAAIVRGANGSLYVRSRGADGSPDAWSNLGHPPGVLVTESPAGQTAFNETIASFRGSDGALYGVKSFLGSSFASFSALGTPPGTTVRGSPSQTEIVIFDAAVVYVRGEDGGLYRYDLYLEDEWHAEGIPSAGALGTSPGSTRIADPTNSSIYELYAFGGCNPNPPSPPISIYGSRSLCLNQQSWNGFHAPFWVDFGQPAPMITVEAPSIVGWNTANSNHVLAMIKAFDGHVYGNLMTNQQKSWFDMGSP